MGNASVAVGGGEEDELVIRVSDDAGAPASGVVLLHSFQLQQDFSVSVDMLAAFTVVSSLLSRVDSPCGSALGALEGSTVQWGRCTFGENHGAPAWSPDDGASGQGCLADYHVTGNIECIDDSAIVDCSNGWLEPGDNPQDYIYAQPFLPLVFDSEALTSFTMKGAEYGTELPTYANNRTWLTLEGTLKSKELVNTPDCLCE